MLFRLFAFLCLTLLSLSGFAEEEHENFSVGAPPEWVVPSEFALAPLALRSSDGNLQYLLIDTQRHWEEKTIYKHRAIRALNQGGVDEVSQLMIDFDPSFNKVILHQIRVVRDGVAGDRMESSIHHIIQQESGLHYGIYSGELSVVYLLDDIRVGDIVEFAYSIIGDNPLFTSHYTDLVFLQYEFPIEKLSYRFLSHPDHGFLIQPINTSLGPVITDLSPDLRQWSWITTDTPTYPYESQQPAWYFPYARIEMSEYRTWQEVADQVSYLFAVPEDLVSSCPEEMVALVNMWQDETDEPKEQALMALRFVQDEVRYQGIEEGIGGFKPRDPREVFETRYGDCKDKTHLLQTLLAMMNIDSTPLLVHTRSGKLIPEVLPSPFVFNHAVLQIEIAGSIYRVDPVIDHQGGLLQNTHFPNYHTALLLSQDAPELIQIPCPVLKRPIEIEKSFRVTSADSADLTISKTFYGSRADAMRRFLEEFNQKQFSEAWLEDMRESYGGAKPISRLSIEDDREVNILRIRASYTIPTRGRSKTKTLKFFSSTIQDYLHGQINPERTSPFALSYPLWVKEHVHIENPFSTWEHSSDEKSYEQGSLFFTHSATLGGQSADFTFELKHLQDHVPKTALKEYWNICQEIEENGAGELTISSLRKNLFRVF